MQGTTADGTRKLLSIRNEYLTASEMSAKLKKQKEQIDSKDSKLFLLGRENLRLKLKLKSLKLKLIGIIQEGR